MGGQLISAQRSVSQLRRILHSKTAGENFCFDIKFLATFWQEAPVHKVLFEDSCTWHPCTQVRYCRTPRMLHITSHPAQQAPGPPDSLSHSTKSWVSCSWWVQQSLWPVQAARLSPKSRRRVWMELAGTWRQRTSPARALRCASTSSQL